jgi:peptide/nickel transport system ATP-binding protein
LLLEIDDLHVTYNTIYGKLDAINGIKLYMEKGETVALIGESGSGKSTLGLAIVRLLPQNGKISQGSLMLDGNDVARMKNREVIAMRGREVFMVFQDPLNSLNPLKRVSTQVLEALRVRAKRDGKPFEEKEAIAEAVEKFRDVRLPDPESIINRYPHQLSGGQIQRVVIAMGLLLKPKLFIADEPTSALDVTIQAQVLKLLNDLKKEYEMSILFITHDITVAYTIADQFMVMYAGEVSELGPVSKVAKSPLHPYTQALIKSIPRKSRREGELVTIPGSPPNMLDLPQGCKFHSRCPYVMDICRTDNPGFVENDERRLRCWLYDPRFRREQLKETSVPAP